MRMPVLPLYALSKPKTSGPHFLGEQHRKIHQAGRGAAVGIGMREDKSRITTNGSRFVPHLFMLFAGDISPFVIRKTRVLEEPPRVCILSGAQRGYDHKWIADAAPDSG
jgi:hypothetical protein